MAKATAASMTFGLFDLTGGTQSVAETWALQLILENFRSSKQVVPSESRMMLDPILFGNSAAGVGVPSTDGPAAD